MRLKPINVNGWQQSWRQSVVMNDRLERFLFREKEKRRKRKGKDKKETK